MVVCGAVLSGSQVFWRHEGDNPADSSSCRGDWVLIWDEGLESGTEGQEHGAWVGGEEAGGDVLGQPGKV